MNTSTYLYADFLTNENTYVELQKFWKDLTTQIAKYHGDRAVDYLNLEQKRTGRPVRNGNPVAARRLESRNQGVRIIQEDLEEEWEGLYAYINQFGVEEDEIVHELVIDIKLDSRSLAIASVLIDRWYAGALTEEVLKRDFFPEEEVAETD